MEGYDDDSMVICYSYYDTGQWLIGGEGQLV